MRPRRFRHRVAAVASRIIPLALLSLLAHCALRCQRSRTLGEPGPASRVADTSPPLCDYVRSRFRWVADMPLPSKRFWRSYRLHRGFLAPLPPSPGVFRALAAFIGRSFCPHRLPGEFSGQRFQEERSKAHRRARPRRKRCRPRTPARLRVAGARRTGRRPCVIVVAFSRQPLALQTPLAPTALPQGAAADAGSAQLATLGRSRRALLPALPLGASILAA